MKSKEEQLKEIVYEFAETLLDEESIAQYLKKLGNIYDGDFRHRYSDFLPMVENIYKKAPEYSIDVLSENMTFLYKYISDNKEYDNSNISLYRGIEKLTDHINLEISHYNIIVSNGRKTNDAIQKLDAVKKDVNMSRLELIRTKKTVDNSQKDLITILSVFSAIILAFSGGINFFANALSGLGKVSICVSAFFVLLCGFVLFNVIVVLLYIVSRIIDKNIYGLCKMNECSECDKLCNGINRIRKRLPYVFWTNITMITLLCVLFGFVVCNT